MQQYLKYYLPLLLLAYLIITFIVPSVRVYKQTAINPVTFGKTDNAHDYIGRIMKVLIVMLIISVLVFSVSNEAYKYLNPIPFMKLAWVHWTGLLLIHTSLVWIIIAQTNMKQSWRIGIDEKNRTDLITNGLFSFSRNPIFLGMIVSTIGIFLVIPNTITFFIAVSTYIIIQIQIRLEEEHLLNQHGQIYKTYKRNVRRLL